MRSRHLLAIAAVSAAATSSALAVEVGIGRPVSGTLVNPFAGVVSAAPGFSVGVEVIYYDADIGGNRATPIGVNLALGLDTQISFTNFSLTYIWDTCAGPWNFASALVLPLASVEVGANVTAGPKTGSLHQDEFGLFDLAIVPVFASYHISGTEHLGMNLTVWAPTGQYDPSNLANLSLNNWTFIPTLAHTRLWSAQNIEFSTAWAMQFYTENPDTDYQNGIVSELEATAIKRFSNGIGIGVIGSWIEQLTDDDGTLADKLDGFRGRAFGGGPIVTYTKQFGTSQLDLNARWIHEFEGDNRFG